VRVRALIHCTKKSQFDLLVRWVAPTVNFGRQMKYRTSPIASNSRATLAMKNSLANVATGTTPTSIDVRSSVAIGGKADLFCSL
jgi:hypothetical protein